MWDAVRRDWRTAPVDEQVRVMLGFLQKLTLEPESLGVDDVRELRAAGVSDQAAEDAILVCALFNTIDRIADALGFAIPEPEQFDRMGRALLKRGYA